MAPPPTTRRRRVRRTALVVAAAAALTGFAAGCGGDSGPSVGGLPDGVVARVGDSEITAKQLAREVARARISTTSQGGDFPEKGTEGYATERADALQRLIEAEIVADEAAACGAACLVTDDEVESSLEEIRSGAGGTDAALAKYLASLGYTVAEARTALRTQAESGKVSTWVTRDVTVTEAEARDYYDDHPDEFRVAEERTASHILVKTKAQATRLRARATEANFAALAARYSTDTGSASSGGEVGTVTEGAFVEEFENAALALDDGEISDPVKTEYGWHLILVEVTAARTRSFDEAHEEIMSGQLDERRQEALAEWRERAVDGRAGEIAYAERALVPTDDETATAGTTTTE
ncbi:MAG: peptidylprolyl isomerase [Thermoleophilia bacterium]